MAENVTVELWRSVKCPFLLIVMQFESHSRRLSETSFATNRPQIINYEFQITNYGLSNHTKEFLVFSCGCLSLK
jgi:hypothetical protein